MKKGLVKKICLRGCAGLFLTVFLLGVGGCIWCAAVPDRQEVAVFEEPEGDRCLVYTQEETFRDNLGRFPFGPVHVRLTLKDGRGRKQDTILFWQHNDGSGAWEHDIRQIEWDSDGVTVMTHDEQGEHAYRLEMKK